MKIYSVYIFVLLFSLSGFAQNSKSDRSKLPIKNKLVLEFVDDHLKKKVGRGECWDLAAQALDNANAEWNHKYIFGKKIESGQKVITGDIIQFKNVIIKRKSSRGTTTVKMAHHTAIVYEVIAPSHYRIAEQNTSQFGRKVGISELNLNEMTRGKVSIYRPK